MNKLTFLFIIIFECCFNILCHAQSLSDPNSAVKYQNCFNQGFSTSLKPPTGGTGNYSFKWETTFDTTKVWTILANRTTPNIEISPISQTTYYRRISSDGINSVTSKTISYIFSGPPKGGHIKASKTTVCKGDTLSFYADTLPSGADGKYTYMWELNDEVWREADSDSLTFVTAPWQKYISYRLRTQSLACNLTFYSNEVSIEAQNPISDVSDNTIQSNQNICVGDQPGILEGNFFDTFNAVYDWYSSGTRSGPFNLIYSSEETNYQPGNLDSTTYFLRKVRAPDYCGEAISNIVTISTTTGSGLVVTTTEDSYPTPACGMLRYAVDRANENEGVVDKITFDLPSGQLNTIFLNNDLRLYEDIYIQGPGRDNLEIINSEGSVFIFQPPGIAGEQLRTEALSGSTYRDLTFSSSMGAIIQESGDLTVINCTFRNNFSNQNKPGGGGIYFRSRNLTVDSCTFSGNRCLYNYTQSSKSGAGIYASSFGGTLKITNTTFSDNSGGNDFNIYNGDGNGMYMTGINYKAKIDRCTFSYNKGRNGALTNGIFEGQPSKDSISITNSTFSGNVSSETGGAIRMNRAFYDLENVTITHNGADSVDVYVGSFTYPTGGGIFLDSANLKIKNTILAGNFSKTGEDYYSSGAKVTSQGGNLFGTVLNSGTQVKPISTDVFNPDGKIDPLLEELQDNGGLTLTHMPTASSPAVGKAISTSSTATDQRGQKRQVGTGQDIGSVEFPGPCTEPFIVRNTGDSKTCGTLRFAITEANLREGITDTITFDLPKNKLNTISLNDLIEITEDIIVNGPGKEILEIVNEDGNAFRYSPPINFRKGNQKRIEGIQGTLFRDLTFRSSIGAIVHEGSDLTVINCLFTNNQSDSDLRRGGAIYFNNVNLTIDSCVFKNNHSPGNSGGSLGGAAVFAGSGGGKIKITNSTFEGNNGSSLNSYLGKGNGVLVNGINSRTEIDKCTFSNNNGSTGAALAFEFPGSDSVLITSSTFSGNICSNTGAAISINGGSSLFRNVTITHNGIESIYISNVADPYFIYPECGGITAVNGAISFNNTILSGNIGRNNPDYESNGTSENSLGGNLFAEAIRNRDFYLSSDIFNDDPNMGPLANNGGLTKTHMPLDGSPAIDNALSTPSVLSDQRGFQRLAGLAQDIGSVEYSDICNNPLVVTLLGDSNICGTLRRAIIVANRKPGNDTITFAIPVSLGSQIDALSPMEITDNLVITGQTINPLSISGGNNNNIFVIKGAFQNEITTELTALTLKEGFVSSGDFVGAAIRATDVNLHLKNCDLKNNSSAFGGGALYFQGKDLLAENCRFTGNISPANTNKDIVNEGAAVKILSGGGTARFYNCSFSGNTGDTTSKGLTGTGNGLFIKSYDDASFSLEIENCTFDKNTALRGGALAYVNRETDSVTIINSTFSGNNAAETGGAINMQGPLGKLKITNTTITENGSLSGSGKAGVKTYGGGIYAFGGKVVIQNSVLAGNKSDNGPDAYVAEYVGTVLQDTILFTKGNNVFGFTDQEGQKIKLKSTDITSQNLLLAPLANNGGFTQTHLPLPGSPVIDAGLNLPSIKFDQRGQPRSLGKSSDIGSVEAPVGEIKDTAFAGADITTCVDDTSLAAKAPKTGFHGKWTILKGSLKLVSDTLYNSKISGIKDTTAVLIWKIQNTAGQLSSSDTLNIYFRGVVAQITKPGLTDTIYVTSKNVSLDGLITGKLAQFTWFKNDTVLSSSNIAFTTKVGKDTSVFKLKADNKICLAFDSLLLIVKDSTKAFAGADQKLCADTTTLNAFKPVSGAHGKWTFLNGVQTTAVILDDTLFNSKLKNIPTDTLQLLWTVNNKQVITKDTVKIINNLRTVKANAGLDKIVTTDTTTLAGNTDGVTHVRWRSQGAAIVVDSSQSVTKIRNLQEGLNRFAYVFLGTCLRVDSVKVIYNLPIDSAQAGKDSSICATSITLYATPPSGNTKGAWRSKTNVVFSDSTKYNSKVEQLPLGPTTLYWLIKVGNTIQSKDSVTIRNRSVIADAGKDDHSCDSIGHLNAGLLKSDEHGKWTSLSPFAVVTPETSPGASVKMNKATGHKLEWLVSNTVCEDTDTVEYFRLDTLKVIEKRIDSIAAGSPIIIDTRSDNKFSLIDFQIVKVDTVTTPFELRAITGVTKNNDQIIISTNPKIINTDSVEYFLTNQCHKFSDFYKVYIKTLNTPPNLTSIPEITDNGKQLSFILTQNILDINQNVKTIRDAGNVIPAKITKISDFQYLVEIDYASNPEFDGAFNLRLEVCDGSLPCPIIEIPVTIKGTLVFFNAISPNKDGKNDYFHIQGVGKYPENTVQVFNRWGDLVFNEKGYDNADVKFDGGELPDGTYYFVFDKGDKSKPDEGYLILKR